MGRSSPSEVERRSMDAGPGLIRTSPTAVTLAAETDRCETAPSSRSVSADPIVKERCRSQASVWGAAMTRKTLVRRAFAILAAPSTLSGVANALAARRPRRRVVSVLAYGAVGDGQ